ncbi:MULTISPECIES: peptidylprolyl isomerase [Marinobacter]|uniref:Chaperone SurA n=1 Tax=Marinobacter profundi TaxID=2666256 RepID=A0A2G1UI44_9GAMM|nr:MULTISPECIES: peptidylprolyl isomerase [Marinobacter]MBD3658078.1 peptidylprolyl isomerase [Marinobacter sp.]PHQ14147.1 molecular chaperone SurA [Marinobacter profundi]
MKAKLRRGVYMLVLMMALVVPAVSQAERQPLDKVVAIVDDGVILQTELDNRINTIVTRLGAQGTGLPPREILAERVLDQLITESIQLQMAEQMGMRVSDNELNETMRSIAERNDMTMAQFEQQLQLEGVSYNEAREQIRREMLSSRVQQRRVGNRVRVTEREVENYLEAQRSNGASRAEYQLAHILVAVEDSTDEAAVAAARSKAERLRQEILEGRDFRSVAVAESDASNALEGGAMGWRPESQLPSLLEGVVPTLPVGVPSEVLGNSSGFHLVMVLDKRGGDTRQVIEQHKVRHILIRPTETISDAQAEQHIRDIHRQLQDGADFAELAREVSDDPVSGSAGGDLGWVNRGQMVPEFESAMLAARVGELEGPFRSQFGWHILQVQERRQKDISGELKESEARQSIYRRKFDQELQNWLREIRDEAFVEIKIGEAADAS